MEPYVHYPAHNSVPLGHILSHLNKLQNFSITPSLLLSSTNGIFTSAISKKISECFHMPRPERTINRIPP